MGCFPLVRYCIADELLARCRDAGRVCRGLSRVPDADTAIGGVRGERSVRQPAETEDNVAVTAEVVNHRRRRHVTHFDAPVFAAGSQKFAAGAERHAEDGAAMTDQDAHRIAVGHRPHAHRTIGRPRGDVHSVRMERHALEQSESSESSKSCNYF